MGLRARRAARSVSEGGVCKVPFIDEKKCSAVEAGMPKGDAIAQIADIFGVLANPTRVRIVVALSLDELCVCDLSRIVGRSAPATSQQLRDLRRMGIVKCRMDGKLAYYRLTSSWVRRLVQDAVRRTNGDDDR